MYNINNRQPRIKGIAKNMKKGLKRVAAKKAYREFLGLKGAHRFSIDLEELRKDRSEVC